MSEQEPLENPDNESAIVPSGEPLEVDPMSSPEEYLKSLGLGPILSDEPRVSHIKKPKRSVYVISDEELEAFNPFLSEPLPKPGPRPPGLVPRVHHFTEQEIQEFREKIFRADPLPKPTRKTEE